MSGLIQASEYTYKLSSRHFNQIELEINDLPLPWKIAPTLEFQVDNEEQYEHITRAGIPIS